MKKFEIAYIPNGMFTKTTTTVSASNIEEVNSKFSLGMIITINEIKNQMFKYCKKCCAMRQFKNGDCTFCKK